MPTATAPSAGTTAETPHDPIAAPNQTLGDDVYLVGVLDKDGSPATNDHEHVSEPELLAVEHEVAPEVREALAKRHEGYAR